MKFLKIAFIAVFVLGMISCGSKSNKTTHIENAESMEMEDEMIEEDETDYLESAMNALEDNDTTKAVEKIMKAVDHIKGYVGEMDDPSNANNAIETLINITAKLKSGAKMSADDLEEALLKLEFFTADDLDTDDEINDDEIENSESE